jgi:hypothetical protein
MNGKPLARVSLRKALAQPEAVTLTLATVDVLLLDALATALSQSREQVVADALRLLFTATARPGDE